MLLKVQNLDVSRGGEQVLESVSFELVENSITGLTGPNGGGKTTLFETLLGLLKKYRGDIVWGIDCPKAYVPQHTSYKKLIPLSVKNFIEMGRWGKGGVDCYSLSVDEVIERLDLGNLTEKLISELSGGQWRKILLARALVQPADLYFLDEPFNHLDVEIENRVGELICWLAKEKKKTFFIISHDWHAMDHYFNHLILLNKKIITQGTVKDVSDVYHNWKNPKHHEWIHA